MNQPAFNVSTANNYHILLADDEPLIIETIGLFLEDEGYRVTGVTSGYQALEYLEAGDFDLIVTDLSMPGLSGFEVMDAAKNIRPDTPIIALTGLGTLDNAVKAIKHGAYDFVTKPVEDLSVFLVSIERALEKRRLLMNQRAYVAQIERQNRAMLQDLEAARRIQACMIERDFAQLRPFLRIATRYQPADIIGGDFYDIFFLPSHFVAIYLADVAGHGVPAAMVTAFAKLTLKKTAEKAAEAFGDSTPSPREILTSFNREMMQQGFERDEVPLYMTVWLGILDLTSGLLRFCNGGHAPEPRLLTPDGLSRLDLAGNPLGLFDLPALEEAEIILRPGQRLFLCTDGVVEAMNRARLAFGHDRLDLCLTAALEIESETLADQVLHQVNVHTGPVAPFDDISIMILEPMPGSGPKTPRECEL